MKKQIMNIKSSALPPLTEQDHARLEALFNLPDSDIDLSDIPELKEENWTHTTRCTS